VEKGKKKEEEEKREENKKKTEQVWNKEARTSIVW
jgi:hypothetical protein